MLDLDDESTDTQGLFTRRMRSMVSLPNADPPLQAVQRAGLIALPAQDVGRNADTGNFHHILVGGEILDHLNARLMLNQDILVVSPQPDAVVPLFDPPRKGMVLGEQLVADLGLCNIDDVARAVREINARNHPPARARAPESRPYPTAVVVLAPNDHCYLLAVAALGEKSTEAGKALQDWRNRVKSTVTELMRMDTTMRYPVRLEELVAFGKRAAVA